MFEDLRDAIVKRDHQRIQTRLVELGDNFDQQSLTLRLLAYREYQEEFELATECFDESILRRPEILGDVAVFALHKGIDARYLDAMFHLYGFEIPISEMSWLLTSRDHANLDMAWSWASQTKNISEQTLLKCAENGDVESVRWIISAQPALVITEDLNYIFDEGWRKQSTKESIQLIVANLTCCHSSNAQDWIHSESDSENNSKSDPSKQSTKSSNA